jgi:hypothetical protein
LISVKYCFDDFTILFNCQGYSAMNGEIFVNDELERIWKKATSLVHLSLLGETE